MSINVDNLRDLVIRPTLEKLNKLLEEPIRLDDSVVELLIGTACHESHCGTYLKQIQGPALGIFQMEPATHDSIWENYLQYRERLSMAIGWLLFDQGDMQPDANEMITNLAYATIMARLQYLPVPEAVPNTLEGQAQYWDDHYNKNPDKGTPEEYIANYQRFAQ